MLSRTTSSRRRRASRAAIGGAGAANNRGTLPARSSAAAAAAAAARSTATRRASVAVGASDTRSSSTPTPPPDDDVPHNRSPRGSLGGDPSPRTSPRNSLTPEGTTRTSPRNSLVPETTRTSPRNSLVPENFNRSPRNSLVPDVTRTSPRNSLVPENYNRSPRNSLVPENFNRSPRNSLVPDINRSPRNSLVPDTYNRSPRNSLVPDTSRSPRNSLVPDSNRSPRNSLVPDSSRSPRNSLVPDSNRSPRNSLVPDPNRSSRGSLVPDPGRSPRGSLIPDNFNRSPRNSLVPETYSNRSPRGSLVPEGVSRSPRGSISSTAGGIVGAAFERGVGFAETAQSGLLSDRNPDAPSEGDSGMAGSSRGGARSQSPYRMSVSARGAQINLGYSGGSTWENAESRRASSNVSQVSADDRRHLCERTKLSSEVGLGLTAYGSFVYQLKDANMEASGTCDFVVRAMRIVYKTVVITVALVCLMSLPLLMLIMGVQYLRDCPVEPHIPVYMVVGGSFGTLKMAWLLWRQVRSRRYERLDLTTPLQEIDAGMSAGTRVVSAALTVFLIVWFALGNYWILHIAWPDYELKLYDPNRWCHKTLYIFAVVHLAILYGIMVLLVLFALSLSVCQLLACPFFIRYK